MESYFKIFSISLSSLHICVRITTLFLQHPFLRRASIGRRSNTNPNNLLPICSIDCRLSLFVVFINLVVMLLGYLSRPKPGQKDP